jgi:hypothetical protein
MSARAVADLKSRCEQAIRWDIASKSLFRLGNPQTLKAIRMNRYSLRLSELASMCRPKPIGCQLCYGDPCYKHVVSRKTSSRLFIGQATHCSVMRTAALLRPDRLLRRNRRIHSTPPPPASADWQAGVQSTPPNLSRRGSPFQGACGHCAPGHRASHEE